jgi:hypothetical protein
MHHGDHGDSSFTAATRQGGTPLFPAGRRDGLPSQEGRVFHNAGQHRGRKSDNRLAGPDIRSIAASIAPVTEIPPFFKIGNHRGVDGNDSP